MNNDVMKGPAMFDLKDLIASLSSEQKDTLLLKLVATGALAPSALAAAVQSLETVEAEEEPPAATGEGEGTGGSPPDALIARCHLCTHHLCTRL